MPQEAPDLSIPYGVQSAGIPYLFFLLPDLPNTKAHIISQFASIMFFTPLEHKILSAPADESICMY